MPPAGCRLPGAIQDLDGLWAALLDGRDLVTQVPEDRFPVDDFVAKACGGDVMDRLTRGTPTDFFVAYSSITGFVGNLHQAPYAAANLHLESLVRARRARTRPGLGRGGADRLRRARLLQEARGPAERQ